MNILFHCLKPVQEILIYDMKINAIFSYSIITEPVLIFCFKYSKVMIKYGKYSATLAESLLSAQCFNRVLSC